MPGVEMTRKTDGERPAIWVGGRQTPPFEPRSFARAALILGRESVADLLARCGCSARGIGGALRAGRWRIPENRLGRSGRFLPSAEGTGAAVLGGADILIRAAMVARPPGAAVAEDEPAAAGDVFRWPEPEPTVADEGCAAAPADPAVRQAGKEDEDLAAIRAIIAGDTARADSGARQAAAPAGVPGGGPAAPADAGDRPASAGRLAAGGARVLGWWMILVSIPWGALRAGLAHLDGQDLRGIGGG